MQELIALYGEGSVRVAAPTGCAAAQFIGGKTLHSLLKIPVSLNLLAIIYNCLKIIQILG